MNIPNTSPPPPPAHPEFPQGTLDERIALAERRLVSRELAVRDRAQVVLHRAQEASSPRRMVRPAVYALGAVAILWGGVRLLRRRRDAKSPGPATEPPSNSSARSGAIAGEVPWVRAAALLWPLLPAAWRARMGPEFASNLVAMGVPLAGVLSRKRTHAPLHPQRSE